MSKYIYNKKEVKKWVKKSIKKRLYVDMENKLLCNGYILFKINDEVLNILKELLIDSSCVISFNRKTNNNMPNFKKIFEGVQEGTHELIDTKLLLKLEKEYANMFLNNKNESIFVNENSMKLINSNYISKITGTDSSHELNFYFDNEKIALLLPIATQYDTCKIFANN